MPVQHAATRRGVHVLLILGLFVAGDVGSSGAVQRDQAFTIEVNDPRPLASAIDRLEKRYGWTITYEDPPYLDASDIEDVTLAVRRDHDRTKPVLGPRGGPFNFRYPMPAGDGAPHESTLLEKLLEAYHLSGYPGVFRVTRTGSVFHVVPSESRNAVGQFAPCVSLLDRNIVIAEEERTALATLEAIVNAVSVPGGARVVVGTVPLNLMIQVRVRGGASNESARTVLLRTLEATHRTLSWSLFCDPGPTPTCALNLHFVG